MFSTVACDDESRTVREAVMATALLSFEKSSNSLRKGSMLGNDTTLYYLSVENMPSFDNISLSSDDDVDFEAIEFENSFDMLALRCELIEAERFALQEFDEIVSDVHGLLVETPPVWGCLVAGAMELEVPLDLLVGHEKFMRRMYRMMPRQPVGKRRLRRRAWRVAYAERVWRARHPRVEEIGKKFKASSKACLMRFDSALFEELLTAPHKFEMKTRGVNCVGNAWALQHGGPWTLHGRTSLVRLRDKSFCVFAFDMPCTPAELANLYLMLEDSEKRDFRVALATAEIRNPEPWRCVFRSTLLKRVERIDEIGGIEDFGEMAWIVGFAVALARGDKLQISTHVCQKAHVIEKLLTELRMDSMESLTAYFLRVLERGRDIEEIAGEEFSGWVLPSMVASTPWVKALCTLSIVLATEQWFGAVSEDSHWMRKLLGKFDGKMIMSATGVAGLVVCVIQSLLTCVRNVIETGDLMALFDVGHEVRAVRDCNEFLRLKSSDLPIVVRQQKIAEMRKLMDEFRVTHGLPMGEIKELFVKSEAHCASLEQSVVNDAPRVIPSVVMLLGEAGAGKTIAFEVMCALAAQLDGDVRFPGDSANIVLNCKFPGSMVPGDPAVVKYLLVNELVDNSLTSEQLGFMPTDLMFQQAIDTGQFTLNHAIAEKKGRNLRSLRLLVGTSNLSRFKGVTGAEKLRRRFDGQLMLRHEIDYDGLRAHFGESHSHEQLAALMRSKAAYVNEYVRLYRMRFFCDKEFFWFADERSADGNALHFKMGELQYRFTDWYAADRAAKVENLAALSKLCTLGRPEVTHWFMTDGDEKRKQCCDTCSVMARMNNSIIPFLELHEYSCCQQTFIDWRHPREHFVATFMFALIEELVKAFLAYFIFRHMNFTWGKNGLLASGLLFGFLEFRGYLDTYGAPWQYVLVRLTVAFLHGFWSSTGIVCGTLLHTAFNMFVAPQVACLLGFTLDVWANQQDDRLPPYDYTPRFVCSWWLILPKTGLYSTLGVLALVRAVSTMTVGDILLLDWFKTSMYARLTNVWVSPLALGATMMFGDEASAFAARRRAQVESFKEKIKAIWSENSRLFSALLLGSAAFIASTFAEADVPLEAGGAFSHLKEKADLGKLSEINIGSTQNFPPENLVAYQKSAFNLPTGKIEFVTPGVNLDDLVALVDKSTLKGVISIKGLEKDVLVTVWNADWISVPTHSLFSPSGETFLESFELKIPIADKNLSYSYKAEDIVYSEKSDTALLRNLTPYKVVVPLSDKLVKNIDAMVVEGTFTIKRTGLKYAGAVTKNSVFTTNKLRPLPLPLWTFPKDVGDYGDCGTPLIIKSASGTAGICAVVSARMRGQFIGFTPFTREHFDDLVSRSVPKNMIVSLCAPFPDIKTHVMTCEVEPGPLAEKSVLREVDDPSTLILGTLPGFTTSFKTHLKPTAALRVITEKNLLKVKYIPPITLKGVYEGKYYSAYANMFGAKGVDTSTPCAKLRAVEQYLERVRPLALASRVQPLDFRTAIFGNPDWKIDPLNKDSSNGGTWSDLGMRNKIDLFDGEVLKPVFVDKVLLLLEKLRSDVLPVPKINLVGKDELRPEAKVFKRAIRLFSTLDIDLNLVARAYLLPIFKVLLSDPAISCIYAKINAASVDFHNLATRLLRFNLFGHGDFSKFDINHLYSMFLAVAVFLRAFSRLCGYSAEDSDIVYRLIMILSVQLVLYMNDLSLRTSSMPSGYFATLMINSLINIFLHLMAYDELVGDRKFFEQVVLAVLGDDHVWSASKAIPNWNLEAIFAKFRSYGYPATPGCKDAAVTPYVSFEELVFLKRSFRSENDVVFGPIETDSMWKALTYEEKNDKVTTLQRAVNVAENIKRESFLHGRQQSQIICDTLSEVMLEAFGVVFPTMTDDQYAVLKEQYDSGLLGSYWSAVSALFQSNRVVPVNNPVEPVKHSPCGYVMDEISGRFRCNPAARAPIAYWANGRGLKLPRSITQNFAELNSNTNVQSSEKIAQNSTVIADSATSHADLTTYVKPKTKDEFNSFSDQMVLLKHYAWTGVATEDETADVVSSFFTATAGTALANRMTNFARFSTKIKVRITVQGSAQSYGLLVASFEPRVIIPASLNGYAGTNVVNNDTKVNYFIWPHLELDPSTSQSYEIELPCISPTGFYSSKAANHYGSYTMRLTPINPLRSGTAVAPTANVCVYVGFDGGEFDAMTAISGQWTAEGSGKLSDVATGLSKVSNYVGNTFPPLSPFTTIFSTVSDIAGGVLNFFGFAKPPIKTLTLTALTRTCDTYSHVDGVTTAVVLGCSQNHTLSIDPSAAGGTLEHMDLRALCATPGLVVADKTITTAGASGTVIFNCPVTPMLCFPDATHAVFTPLSGCAFVHKWWVGTLDFDFQFIASVFQRCTVLIAYDPLMVTTTAPSLAVALTNLNTTTVQISGNTRVRVRIPYRQVATYLETGKPKYEADTSTTDFNGRILMYIVNPVQNNGGTDSIAYNVYLSSQDIVLACPTPAKIGDALVVTEAISGLWRPNPGTVVALGTIKDDVRERVAMSLGDVSRSVKDVTVRSCNFAKIDAEPSGAVVDIGGTAIQLWNYPVLQTGNLVPAVIPLVVAAPYGLNRTEMTFVSYFAAAYQGFRGSLNWSIGGYTIVSGNYAGKDQGPLTCFLSHHIHSPSSGPILPIGGNPPATVSEMGEAYAWTQTNMDIVSRADGIFPMMVPLNYTPAGVVWTSYSDAVRYHFDRVLVDRMSTNVNLASGDDFTLMYFKGFPRLMPIA